MENRPIGYGEWVNVKRALPQEDEWCLVYANGAMACRAYMKEKEWFVDFENCTTPGFSIGRITHWSHLPMAPLDLCTEEDYSAMLLVCKEFSSMGINLKTITGEELKNLVEERQKALRATANKGE